MKDPVWGTGGYGTEDMGGMEVLDGGLKTIGEENTIGEVWGNGGEETGLESVADTTGTRGTSGKGMGGVGGNEGAGEELGTEEG